MSLVTFLPLSFSICKTVLKKLSVHSWLLQLPQIIHLLLVSFTVNLLAFSFSSKLLLFKGSNKSLSHSDFVICTIDPFITLDKNQINNEKKRTILYFPPDWGWQYYRGIVVQTRILLPRYYSLLIRIEVRCGLFKFQQNESLNLLIDYL